MEVNVFLFDDFDTMSAFGAAEVFGRMPEQFHVRYLSAQGNIVNSMQGVKVWTELLETEKTGGILIIPGGKGARRLLCQEEETLKMIKRAIEKSTFCLMVESGSALAAQTGLLYRRKIAQCRVGNNWKQMFMAGPYELQDANWVSDGKYYSSCNAMMGIAMSLGVVADQIDFDEAVRVAGEIGYEWNREDENVYD